MTPSCLGASRLSPLYPPYWEASHSNWSKQESNGDPLGLVGCGLNNGNDVVLLEFALLARAAEEIPPNIRRYPVDSLILCRKGYRNLDIVCSLIMIGWIPRVEMRRAMKQTKDVTNPVEVDRDPSSRTVNEHWPRAKVVDGGAMEGQRGAYSYPAVVARVRGRIKRIGQSHVPKSNKAISQLHSNDSRSKSCGSVSCIPVTVYPTIRFF